MHGLFEVDGVQRFDDIPVLFQHLSAFNQDCTFRISDAIGTVHLHEVGLDEKSGLAGAGTADNEDVLVPRVLRLLGTAVHGQRLGLGEDDVVGELVIHIGLDVLWPSPSG